MKYVIFGLSITSAWGNGHATTYRSLVRAMAARGHEVTFLERDVPWYREHRDAIELEGVDVELYDSLETLRDRQLERVRNADAVMIGSYVPEGIALTEWVLRSARGVSMFYDIDTPITLAGLSKGGTEYLTRSAVPQFDLYLSFTGGPTLARLEREFGARRARALYCSVDPARYRPRPSAQRWQLGYLGTYSDDRQAALDELLLKPAHSLPRHAFVVSGAQYPADIRWPANVERREHVAPEHHAEFYGSQRFTLNLTRQEMIRAGHSPSVRLFEAAACGVPIISDEWPGLSELFRPGKEVLLASSARDVLGYLVDLSDDQRAAIADSARAKVLSQHTSEHRVTELDGFVADALGTREQAPGTRRAITTPQEHLQ